MKAVFTLTSAESRRLIAKAVLAVPEVQKAWNEAYLLLAGGTTNAFVAQELLEDRSIEPGLCTAGISCDGAKISCAAKIATSVDAGMMAHYLSMNHRAYQAFTGILKESAGETIRCVGHIGKVGMRQTDKEIVKKMLDR